VAAPKLKPYDQVVTLSREKRRVAVDLSAESNDLLTRLMVRIADLEATIASLRSELAQLKTKRTP
jgi:hypothetical protein